MAELRRRCSSCGESYPADVLFCPHDGGALSARRSESGKDPLLGQTLAGAFRIEALVGSGAVGRVYRAQQLGIERLVALKVMHHDLACNEEVKTRFRREARIAGVLDHPNLVRVLLLTEIEQNGLSIPMVAFEYLDGLSLRSALVAKGSLSASQTLHTLLQVADALGHAHQRGIVHRDLKPENVMLVQRGDDPGFVKVLDFGVAHVDAEHRAAEPGTSTRAGAIFGSPRYVAPECAAGAPSSKQSDVYALATIGYECLTGHTPFDGDNAIQVLLKQQREPVVPIRERAGAELVPAELARVIEQNLGKDPETRAKDAHAFFDELTAVGLARTSHRAPALTRRGHDSPELFSDLPAPLARGPACAPAAERPSHALGASAARRALFVVLCFTLGAGAALAIAERLGAFASSAVRPFKGAP